MLELDALQHGHLLHLHERRRETLHHVLHQALDVFRPDELVISFFCLSFRFLSVRDARLGGGGEA